MRTSRACRGPFRRAVSAVPTRLVPLLLGFLSIGVPAAVEAEPGVPTPWELAPTQSTASWLRDPGAYPVGARPVGVQGCARSVGCHPLANGLWFRGEYLVWWNKAADLPPLATTSPPGTPIEEAGVLGFPDTDVLSAPDRGGAGVRLGTRLTLGWWISPCQVWGVESTYTSLRGDTARRRFTSEEHRILSRPFFNVQSLEEDAVVLAYPERREGAFQTDLSHRFDSVEVLFRRAVFPQCDRPWYFLAGYRYARMDEQLALESSSTFIGALEPVPAGTLIEATDRFHANNEFHGAQLGLATAARYCDWSLELTAKLGLGGTRSRVTVAGETAVTVPPGEPVTHPGGMLALPSNTGTEEQRNFAMIPELGVTVGWDLTCRLKATLGYSFVYWNRVARPGDQIDRELDPAQFPPAPEQGETLPAPAPRFVVTDYWVQGLNFGLDYRF